MNYSCSCHSWHWDCTDSNHLPPLSPLQAPSASTSAGLCDLSCENDPDHLRPHLRGQISGSLCLSQSLLFNFFHHQSWQGLSRDTQVDHMSTKLNLLCPFCVTATLSLFLIMRVSYPCWGSLLLPSHWSLDMTSPKWLGTSGSLVKALPCGKQGL